MKRLAIILSVLMIFAAGCKQKTGKSTQKQEKTVSYVNSKYGFQVDFPGTPEVMAAKVNTSLGPADNILFSYKQGNVFYVVQLTIYPEMFANQVNATKSVQTQVETLAENMNLSEVKSEVNNIEGRPSMYYEGSTSGGYAIFQAIAHKNKVFVVGVMAEGPDAAEQVKQSAARFIKSFKMF